MRKRKEVDKGIWSKANMTEATVPMEEMNTMGNSVLVSLWETLKPKTADHGRQKQ